MLLNSLRRLVEGLPPGPIQNWVRTALEPIYDRFTSFALTTAGLVIKAGGGVLVKTGGAVTYLLANGLLVKIAAATDQAALAGTVVNATFNVFCFFVDSAGVLTSAMGVAGATLAAVKFPQFPVNKALVGFIIVNPTGTGNFVGGTTALDDATVVPNVVYISPTGPFDPYCVIV